MPRFFKIQSDSGNFTRQLGRRFASLVSRGSFFREPLVVFLKGDLGSGKTTFVLGFLRYFGIKPVAASPTFVILKSYKVKSRKYKVDKIHHVDAYRLKSKRDLDILGFGKIIKDPKNVILIEWPERVKGLRIKDKMSINFFHGQKENERTVVVKT
jgi:tRNA threonylcarbamoyladenosine biosynthesis protein TsaE